MTAGLNAVLHHVESHLDHSRTRWIDLLRIASVSAQPAHAGDCAAAAAWLRRYLSEIGFDAQVVPTAGHPVVLAHHPGTGPGPRLLYYGHYDVQPAEPLELWTTPPFEPAVKQGPHGAQIAARGAVDDKGQVMMWLEALRAWHAVAGGPPCPTTVLIEGEEEVGSANLDAFLAAHRAGLGAEIAIISDTGMWDIDTPAITARLRGMVYAELTLHAAHRDLHSGLYGGVALNPINALTAILGGLHDADGRVQLPGFYDGIPDASPEQLAQWHALRFDEAAFLAEIGLKHAAGERQRTPLERMWARPTADINGIWGGYTGPGAKTVIAAHASAKVSFRLVPGQDPASVFEGFQRFVAERMPPDARVTFELFSTAPGILVPTDNRFVRAAQDALADEYGRPAVLMGSGGSIPVVASLKELLGLDSLLMGFGLPDDQVHSPNEKFEWRCFHRGLRSHVRLLDKLAA